MDLAQFREMYSTDVAERLVRMNQLALSLEADPTNREMIDTLFRETHSLKGMAASMQYDQTENLAHQLENFLDPCRRGGEISTEVIDLLLAGFDLLKDLLDDIDNDRPERTIDLKLLALPSIDKKEVIPSTSVNNSPQRPEPTPVPDDSRQLLTRVALPKNTVETTETDRSVRIRTELLDQLINLTGELMTNRFMLQSARCDNRWADLDDGLDNLGKLVGNLHHHVLKARMTPLKKITAQLPRLVRDLARKTGKDVTLVMTGDQLELDRSILELLADPLVHLIRNAVDHGIEGFGQITLRAWREKNLAFLEIADNGRGIDPEMIRQRVVAKGLMNQEKSNGLERKELLQIICMPGFSTKESAGEISGRGVGMDVVKKSVDSLGGTLEITSSPGEGSAFLLKLPLTIFIIRILLVRSAGRVIGLPISRILSVQEFNPTEGEDTFLEREKVHRWVSLATLLDLEDENNQGEERWVAFAEMNGKVIGITFGSLIGQRETYVKPLSSPLNQLHPLTGTTVLGEGQIVFIVDPLILLQKEIHSRSQSQVQHPVKMRGTL